MRGCRQHGDAGLDAAAGDAPRVAVLRAACSRTWRWCWRKADIAIASRYADLVTDPELRTTIFGRIRDRARVDPGPPCCASWAPDELLAGNPQLARSIKYRFPYLDPLNHIQVELLRRYRAGDKDERSRRGIHLTINGIAAGLRNSG